VIHALLGLRVVGFRRRISWLVADACGAAGESSALDEIIRFDRKRYGQVRRNFAFRWRSWNSFGYFAKRFGLVVDLQGCSAAGFGVCERGHTNRFRASA
jgi:hypothetical protein